MATRSACVLTKTATVLSQTLPIEPSPYWTQREERDSASNLLKISQSITELLFVVTPKGIFILFRKENLTCAYWSPMAISKIYFRAWIFATRVFSRQSLIQKGFSGQRVWMDLSKYLKRFRFRKPLIMKHWLIMIRCSYDVEQKLHDWLHYFLIQKITYLELFIFLQISSWKLHGLFFFERCSLITATVWRKSVSTHRCSYRTTSFEKE